MSDFERIGKNSIYSFLSTFFRLFSNVILFWLIARFYGKDIFGQFTTAQTFASIFTIFADFGIDILLTTELPRNKKNFQETITKYFSLKILLTILCFIVLIFISIISDFPLQLTKMILIFGLYAIFTTLTKYFYALFKGKESLIFETKVSFFVNFATLITVLPLILMNQDIIIITIIFAVLRFLGLGMAIYLAFKLFPNLSFEINFKDTRLILKKVVVFGLFFIFGNLYFQLDTILLSYIKGEESVGVYQAVFRFVMLPLIIPDILINSILPTLSRLNVDQPLKWEKLGYTLYRFLFFISIPIGLILFFNSAQLIYLIYGNEFSESIIILKIFALIIIVRFFGETFGLMLTSSNNQGARTIIVFSATIVNLALNLIFIPQYGVLGAALISLITNIFVASLNLYVSKSLLQNWLKSIVNMNLFMIFILLILANWYFSNIKFWYLCFIIPLLYFSAIYKFVLTQWEKNYLKNLRILGGRFF